MKNNPAQNAAQFCVVLYLLNEITKLFDKLKWLDTNFFLLLQINGSIQKKIITHAQYLL